MVAITSPAPCIVCGTRSAEAFLTAGAYTIHRCRDCGLGFLWPQGDEVAQKAIYSEAYFRSQDPIGQGYADYASEADNHRRTFRDRLRLMGDRTGRGRLLDVGAATGFFVEQAIAAGWNAEGIEFSPWAARYAREVVGVPVREGTLEGAGFEAAAFDVVTMWEVIEHLPDPREVLNEIRRVLAPGGMLYLSTPDAGSAVARGLGKRWLGWKKIPEHLFYFDRPSLTQLLTSCGFEVLQHRYVPLTVTWRYALERLGAIVGVPDMARVPASLGDRSVRVNCYYDLMTSARVR